MKSHNIYNILYILLKRVCCTCNLILIVQNIAGSLDKTRSNGQTIDRSGKEAIGSFSNVKNGRTDTKYTYVERKVIEDKLALSPIVVRAKLLKLNKKNKKTKQTRKVLFKEFLPYECKFQLFFHFLWDNFDTNILIYQNKNAKKTGVVGGTFKIIKILKGKPCH